MKEPSVSYRLANEISARTGQEIRVTIPGHFQRGGSPCAYDRMLTTRFGTAAAELIANKKFGAWSLCRTTASFRCLSRRLPVS